LTIGDWAALGTFAAALLAAIAAGLALYASFRVASRQERIAADQNASARRVARIRSLAICREAIWDARSAVEALLDHSSPSVDVSIVQRLLEAHAGLAEALKQDIAVDAIQSVVAAKIATAYAMSVAGAMHLPLLPEERPKVEKSKDDLVAAYGTVNRLLRAKIPDSDIQVGTRAPRAD
jgi:hypothetical protein